MEKMQISVVGRETGQESDIEYSDGDQSVSEEENDNEDNLNEPVSHKHTKFTDLESRAREDMDFPDEVDTPFTDARVRF